MKLFLKIQGRCKIFRNGKEFIDYINQENPDIDLVFMDFLIPLINGIECIRIFRKERKKTGPNDYSIFFRTG